MAQEKIIINEMNLNPCGSEGPRMEEAKTNQENGLDTGDAIPRAQKGKNSHRHTPEQIQEMDKLFKESPRPSDKERKELAAILGMEPSQVKFWFQNKRNQMKTKRDQSENVQLRRINEQLKNENNRYREALCNAVCASCGHSIHVAEMSHDEFRLEMENVALRKEIEHVSRIVATASHTGKPPVPPP